MFVSSKIIYFCIRILTVGSKKVKMVVFYSVLRALTLAS